MSTEPSPGFRIERCGNLYVYHPIRQPIHTTQTEASVMCA